MNRRIVQIIMVALLATITAAPRSVAFEFVTSRGLGMGRTLLISEPTASTLLQLPSADIKRNQLILEAGALREFEIKELDRAYLAAAGRIGKFILAVGIAQLGRRDFYAEKTLRASLAYQDNRVGGSINISGVEYDFGGYYESLRAATFGAALSYKHDRIYVGGSFDNLNSPVLLEGRPKIEPEFSFYAELKGKGAYSILGRATFEKDEDVVLAVAQKIDISRKADIFWGLSGKPFQLGGGMDMELVNRSHFSYTGSYHPELGFSHNLSLIFTFGSSKNRGKF